MSRAITERSQLPEFLRDHYVRKNHDGTIYADGQYMLCLTCDRRYTPLHRARDGGWVRGEPCLRDAKCQGASAQQMLIEDEE